MRSVLLIGGACDGDRVLMENDRSDVLFRVPRLTAREFWQEMQVPSQSSVRTVMYRIERFVCGSSTAWVAYPEGTPPEHGLAMLLAGYVGNQTEQ